MKLKIDLQNCYGIGALNHEVEYPANNNTAVVYAPNGSMKTSLTKTFDALLAGKEPCDEFYPARPSRATITIDGTALSPTNTYVFSKNDPDCTKQISAFLANEALKTAYDAIYGQLDSQKKGLKKQIKKLAQSSDCEDEILAAFKTSDEDNFFDCLLLVKQQLAEGQEALASDFKFNDVFEKTGKVKDFIAENHETIRRYFEKYTELLQTSNFFSSGAQSFGTTHANSLLKTVGDNRFFLAGHKFELGGEGHPKIASKDEMAAVIQGEMDRILTDDEIRRLFNDLDSKLDKNVSLKGFKEAIQGNPLLIPELVNYDEFQRKILRGYLVQCEAEMNSLTELYAAHKDELKEIVRRAGEERSEWERVIKLFNTRFYVPFELKLQNKSDILLNAKTPELTFLYSDGGDAPIPQERKTLVDHLSAGEKNAFNILQNIFELEARRVSGQQTLLVFDDIADSFDYKNKYAIIEYLNDLSRDGNFWILILTHNFDFYRTVTSRLYVGGNIFFADRKDDRSVKMCQGIYSSDILKNKLLDKVTQRRNFIACIPFVRNIIEYTYKEGDKAQDYKDLTLCMHLKDDTPKVKFSDLIPIFNRVIKITEDKAFAFGADNYLTALMDEAEAILEDPNEVEIVNKLVLSIAIRIKAEEYMQGVLDEAQLSEIKPNRNRTGELLRVMKKYHLSDMEDQCLEMNKVLMLTSENIHFNNFMFEPLVDISILHLKDLYNEVKALLGA